MTETARESSWACWWADATPRDWRNLRRLLLTLAAWAVSFVGGAQLLKRGLIGSEPVAWLLAGLPALLAVLSVMAYGRYLREADELQRMIHLRALGLGFGAGWLAVAGYRLFERMGAPPVDRGDVALVMAGAYTVGILLGVRRYA